MKSKKEDQPFPFSNLAGSIEGEVHADTLRRYLLSTDASIFGVMPAAVVYPKTTADVQTTLCFAAQRGLSVHPRGAGSGLCGSAVGEGIVLDFSKFMNRLLQLDLDAGWFECQPGFRMGELEAALDGSALFFPPDPSSGEYATFGGMCNTNASGAHSVKYGNVADYLMDAEVVFSDGTVAMLSWLEALPLAELPENLQQLAALYQQNADTIERAYPSIACNVAGYNLRGMVAGNRLRLRRLLAGAEGTLAVVTRLKFRLIERPAADALVVAYFDDIVQAARAVQLIMPLAPSGIEIMDKSLLNLARASDAALQACIPAGVDNVLLIEFDGPSAQACAQMAVNAQQLLQAHQLTRHLYPAATAEEKAKFWAVRKAAVPILYKLKGSKKILALVEDAAVPVDQLVPYFKGVYAIFARHGVAFVLYGHIAKGLMHTRPLLNLKDPQDVVKLRPIADDLFDLVDGLDGTVSGEHGDGRLRSAYLQRKYPGIYPLFKKVNALLDPLDMLNPEIKKADDPSQMTRHLRYGPHYRARQIASLALSWPETFDGEAEKCHGCAKCTTLTCVTRMCPVYKFTRDEAAAPKAKANVLRALISGAVNAQALYSAGLHQVMAQCVNCGSCYAECPSNVNIPKLAMEAKAQYVLRYGAPLVDKLTAHVESAARLTHRLSALITPAVGVPLVRNLAARLTGLAPQREMVVFARRSLYQQVPRVTPGSGPSVLYYAGCYAAYIRPQLGKSTVQVLSHMGYQVHLPAQFCCGLPQLSKGMVAGARGKVRRNLDGWQALLNRVDHVVVTCSSCGYALMKDWAYLLPEDEAVEQVSRKTIHISQFLREHRERLNLSHLPVKLAYHQPCHLRIQPDSDSSMALLATLPGVEVTDLKSHCCGMAGSWGLIAGNYALSKTIGTPMVAELNTSGAHFGVTDCPTCQMQMAHLGHLPVRHPIEIVHAGLTSVK
jgi:FAD/FMN-containing dehydrogenase/Fe-S oxidoreductase